MNGSLPEPIARADKNGHADAGHLIELLRTLADPIRLRIVRLIESGPQQSAAHDSPGGGLSVGELGEILKLPQSTVSRHLKTLADAGLVDARREGTSMFYGLSPAAMHNSSKQLRQIARSHLEHDPVAKNDTHRLSAVLRRRESATETFFGKHAPQWDELRAQWFGETFHLEGLLTLLNPAWTVVDIGTGTGAMASLLAPHVARVVGVDPSAAMLKAAKARLKSLALDNVEIRQGTAEALPLDPASVDVALLALVLAYTADPALVLADVKRVLKPGGTVLILDLQPHGVDLFREKLNHRWMGFSQDQLSRWLDAAGFINIRWHPLSPRHGRAKDNGKAGTGGGVPIPDLFALRAEAK